MTHDMHKHKVAELEGPRLDAAVLIERLFSTPPRKGTPAADLTDFERVALCLAAGAPYRIDREPSGMVKITTAVPCGIADRGDGGWIVAIGASERPSDTVTVDLTQKGPR